MSAPVLITGADGFVGRHLAAELGGAAFPADVDVTDVAALTRAVAAAAPRAVVHLAAYTSVADSWAEPDKARQVNEGGAVNVLDAVRAAAQEARVLFLSTGEVYGNAARVPTPEDEPPAAVSPYAASKVAAERACAQAARDGIDVVVARAFQQEGPGRSERHAIGSWAAQLARAEEAGGGTVYVGNLLVRRDLTDVRDACRAYRLLLEPQIEPGIYNVASGTAVSLRDVLERLVAMARVPVSVEDDPSRQRPADLPLLCGDPSKLRAATGWEPRISLDETLSDTLTAAREGVAEGMAKT